METTHKGPQKIRQFPHFWTIEFDVSTKTGKHRIHKAVLAAEKRGFRQREQS